MKLNTVICDDIFNVMPKIADKSIDMILTDMPYNTTACSWDKEVIPLDNLWEGFKRIIKDNGAIVMTASQPFTSKLVMSNLKMFKYELIWEKERPTNFMQGKKQILKYHENILIFYKRQCAFNPILEKKKKKNKRNNAPRGLENKVYGIKNTGKYSERCVAGGNKDWIYPKSVLNFSMERGLHPTQKPVALFEYLIKTYTNEGDIVLDNCIGSGTTAIAAMHAKRDWIGIEKDEAYCDIAEARIKEELNDKS